jgi:beta-carotene ketolase (CrtO type)
MMGMFRTTSLRPDTDADVVVIGAGHNGLVTAAYLARAGLRTVVLEARHDVGGCASSEGFAGATVNICNCDHMTFRTTPVMDELDLGAHGLRYLEIDPAQMNMSWDGGPAHATFKDVERTLDGLALTHPDQVDGYRRYCEAAIPVARLILAAGADLPTRPRLLRTVLERRGRGVSRLLAWSRRSAAEVMRQFFTSDAITAPALSAGPVVWGLSPETPGTGLGALTLAIRHVVDVGRPEGGSGMLPVALRSALEAACGSIRTGARVVAIECDTQGVRGVRLVDGTEITASVVVSACDPHSTFLDWLTNPPRSAGPMIERWRTTPLDGGYESKIDAVLSELPRYRQVIDGLEERLGFDVLTASMMIAPSLRDIDAGHRMMADGAVMPRPVHFANVPTVVDPTMAPAGLHVFSLETLFTPYDVAGGWATSTEPARWLDGYATLVQDGWRDSVVDWRVMTPADYESQFHLPKGHATSFAGGPLMALRARPRELTRYETPVEGLYITGAATFPGAGIWGSSGRSCALTILRRYGLDTNP